MAEIERLSKVQRLMLANQYRILQHVDPGNSDDHASLKRSSGATRRRTRASSLIISAADTASIVAGAKEQSPKPNLARITQLVLVGDTAIVTVFTQDVEQRLRFTNDGRMAGCADTPRHQGALGPMLKIAAVACLLAAAPLAAQSSAPPRPTSADTAAIVRAAADSVWRYAGGISLQIVADTAWVMVARVTETYRRDTAGASDVLAAAFTHEMRRVERRNGQWVRDSVMAKP
jgi:hypothetical protein